MKFLIDETDLPKLPPGVQTRKEVLTYLDYRTVPTLEEAENHHWYNDWFNRGINHREDKSRNMVVCDVPGSGFIIEVNSLEELADLITKMEGIIITKSHYLETPFQIGPEYY